MLNDPGSYGLGPPLLTIGVVILAVVGLLGWVAFRKRKPPAAS